MKTNSKTLGFLLAPLMLLAPAIGSAGALNVQTAGNVSNAAAGEAGADVSSSALISVVVTNASTGAPMTSLGASIGDGTSEITLPTSWTLFSNLNVPPGGCLLTPTQFYNWGNGAYNIRVVPFLGNASCHWSSGDYHYVVSVNNVGRSATNKGSGLGVINIP